MNMFENVELAPADPILGLSEAFRSDPNPEKINLSVGVYQNNEGHNPVLESVRKAAKKIVESEKTKSYLPIAGIAEYHKAVQELIFGYQNEMIETGRVATLQTPGGTGALRLAGDFVRQVLNRRTVWVSRPTWANHEGIFSRADLEIQHYPYFDKETHSLNLEGFLAVLEDIPNNDVVVFHACCHNPTGVDPSNEDWETIAKICKEHQLLPILDFAYQGFSQGLVQDAVAVRAFSEYGLEFIVCSSYSKNFGLYRERVGALSVVAKNKDECDRVLSQLKTLVRTNYSNPPFHGGAIIPTILNDFELKQEWETELHEMRSRIWDMRNLFVSKLQEHKVPGDYSFIKDQTGMFSFSGLTPETVEKLRQRHSIYLVNSGRINVSGITTNNVDKICEGIKDCIEN